MIFTKIHRPILMITLLTAAVFLEILVTPLRYLGIKLNYPVMKLWAIITLKLYKIKIIKLGENSKIPSIIATNHISYWDILTLAAKFKAYFVAKSSVKTWPLIGQGALFTRTIFINRSKHKASLNQLNTEISKRIGQKEDVIMFAEGTTSAKPCRPFKIGAFYVSIQTNIPIKPLAVYYDQINFIKWIDDDTFVSHLWKMTFAPRINCYIFELPLMYPANYTSANEMKVACQNLVQEKIDYLIAEKG